MPTCDDYRSQLVSYINRELPRRKQQRLAKHLQHCEGCYAAYVRERDTAQHLTRELMLLGQSSSSQLDSIWDAVTKQVNSPTSQTANTSKNSYNWQPGAAWAALVILCMIPWTMSWNNLVSVTSTLGVTPVDVPVNTPDGTRIGAAQVQINAIQFDFDVPTEDALDPTPTVTPPAAPIPR